MHEPKFILNKKKEGVVFNRKLHQDEGTEVFGTDLLTQIGGSLYAHQSPTTVFHQEKTIEITNLENGYRVKMKIPFIKSEDFELRKYGDELIIDIANRRKSMFLPKFANYHQFQGLDLSLF